MTRLSLSNRVLVDVHYQPGRFIRTYAYVKSWNPLHLQLSRSALKRQKVKPTQVTKVLYGYNLVLQFEFVERIP